MMARIACKDAIGRTLTAIVDSGYDVLLVFDRQVYATIGSTEESYLDSNPYIFYPAGFSPFDESELLAAGMVDQAEIDEQHKVHLAWRRQVEEEKAALKRAQAEVYEKLKREGSA